MLLKSTTVDLEQVERIIFLDKGTLITNTSTFPTLIYKLYMIPIKYNQQNF